MNPHDMLDYALGLADDAHREQLDRMLAADPYQAERLARLRGNLDQLLDDGDDPAPPADLARRTILLVEVRRNRPRILDYAPVRSPFRWADFAVAAGIFVAGLVTLLPAMQGSRSAANLASCANNLRQIGLGMLRYATTHEMFPQAPPDSAVPYAGSLVSMLRESQLLDSMAPFDCPADGSNSLPSQVPCTAELSQMVARGPRNAPCLDRSDYAANMGFFGPDRQWRPLPVVFTSYTPLMADHPPFRPDGRALDGNSPNHGGRGQNVLRADGSVGFSRNRRIGGDQDMFRNRLGHTAPGLSADDFVLGAGTAPITTVP